MYRLCMRTRSLMVIASSGHVTSGQDLFRSRDCRSRHVTFGSTPSRPRKYDFVRPYLLLAFNNYYPIFPNEITYQFPMICSVIYMYYLIVTILTQIRRHLVESTFSKQRVIHRNVQPERSSTQMA